MSDDTDLMDDLTDIDGVGEATAEKVLGVLDDHGATDTDAHLDKAREAAAAGDDRRAAVFLRRSNA